MVIDMSVRTQKHLIAITLCLIIAAGAVNAASFTYSSQAKRIKAGVLILPNTAYTGAGRPNPYIFYVMDQRSDLKPSGWEFYNPFAPSQVTSDITDRWLNTYMLGATVDKSMGCYWEVPISSMSPEDLAQYDVLFLTGYNTGADLMVALSGRDQEKLRKFVDNGGVLWLDYERTAVSPFVETKMDPQRPFFIPYLRFLSGGAGASVPAVVPPQSRAHSLLNRPFFLSQTDIQYLGGYGPANQANTEYLDIGGFAEKAFVPIVTRGANATIAAAQYGSGYVVVTADNVGQAVTNPVGVDATSTGSCTNMFIAAQPEDLKFAYNIVNWGSEHSTFHKNARRTGASFAEIGMSLEELWRFELPAAGQTPTDSSPAILDDMIFYVDGNNILHAFDLSPIRDRDGDGDPDDGVLDYSEGRPYDELWNANLGSPSSSPTAAYVQLVAGEPVVPAVFVTTSSGVVGFNALQFTHTSGPTAVPYFTDTEATKVFKPFDSNPVGGIPAPTYVDGALYAGDGWGLLHVHDFLATTSTTEWCHPHADTVSNMGVPCSPTVGYFFDPTSGATEQVAYIATHGTPGGTTPADGSVRSYPISVHNEVLTQDTKTSPHDQPGALWFRTRNVNSSVDPDVNTYTVYTSQGLDNLAELGPTVLDTSLLSKIDVVDTSGNTAGPTGWFKLTTSGSGLQDKLNAGCNIVADYKLRYIFDNTAYSSPVANPAFRSIGIRHPSSGGGNPDYRGISGSPAAGKNDVLYFGTENNQFYAIQESGKGTGVTATSNAFIPLMVKWRWYLDDPRVKEILGRSFNGSSWVLNTVNFPGTSLIPNAVGNIVGAPVLIGDMVYYAVNDDSGQGYLLAFKADPVFSVTLDKDITPGSSVTVLQWDNMTDPGHTQPQPPQYSAVAFTDTDKAPPSTTVLVDFDTRKVTLANFRARSAGELSASEDMVVAYQPYDPNQPVGSTPTTINESHPAFATGKRDQVNNLVWFMRILSPAGTPLAITSSPMAMGNVVYLGCSGGYLCAIDVSKADQSTTGHMVPMNDGSASGVILKDWNAEYAKCNRVPGATDNITAPVAGSHGMLAVATSTGLSIMYNPVTLVADGNRLVEVNVDGSQAWTCDSTNSFASTYAASTSGTKDKLVFGASNIPFNRPSVARKAYVGGTIVADTGNNRIVHIDKGGSAIWEIKDFVQYGAVESAALGLPYPMLPPGSPMELNKPTDVTCWMTMAPMDISNSSSQMLPVYHYLIADSGNHRVLEIVNRYDMVTQTHRNYIVQVSKELVQKDPTTVAEGRALQFRTARIAAYGANGPSEVVCAVTDEDSTKPDMTGSGGALIRIDWTTGNILNGTVNALPIDTPVGSNSLVLVTPSFFNRQMISNTEYADVVIDARGVHLLNKVGNNTTIRSYLNPQHVDYQEDTGNPLAIPGVGTHPRPFAPSYAQYLPNGHVLVTNRATGLVYYTDPKTGVLAVDYSGQPVRKAFYGEIFELMTDPADSTALIRAPGTSIWYQEDLHLHQPLSAERALY
jgi:hypothetical protein